MCMILFPSDIRASVVVIIIIIRIPAQKPLPVLGEVASSATLHPTDIIGGVVGRGDPGSDG